MSRANVKRQVQGQLRVVAAVVLLAIVSATVTVLSDAPAIVVVMAVAAIQGALILAFLMHLKGEVPLIQSLLAFSAFFLIVLLGLTLLGLSDPIEGTTSLAVPAALSESAAGEEH